MPYCLEPHGLLSLSCTSEDHLTRGNRSHNQLCLLTSIIKQSFFIYLPVDQSYGDIFSIESSSFHTTLTCIKLTTTQHGAHGRIGRASKGLGTPISSSFAPCNINSLSFGPTPFFSLQISSVGTTCSWHLQHHGVSTAIWVSFLQPHSVASQDIFIGFQPCLILFDFWSSLKPQEPIQIYILHADKNQHHTANSDKICCQLWKELVLLEPQLHWSLCTKPGETVF